LLWRMISTSLSTTGWPHPAHVLRFRLLKGVSFRSLILASNPTKLGMVTGDLN